MAKYSLSYVNVDPAEITANIADPIKAVVCGATASVAISEIYIAGEESASAVTELVVNRPSVQGNPYANFQTPERLNPFSQAASGWQAAGQVGGGTGTVGAARPTFSANDILNLTLNAFAGVVRWVAPPGSEIIATGSGLAGEVTFGGSRGGTGNVSGHVIVEQL
jgi:hypothetical protein